MTLENWYIYLKYALTLQILKYFWERKTLTWFKFHQLSTNKIYTKYYLLVIKAKSCGVYIWTYRSKYAYDETRGKKIQGSGMNRLKPLMMMHKKSIVN